MLYIPHNMKEHKHRNLLQHIVEQIKHSPGTVSLYKVKAHTGIEGNEKADAMAKKVARGEISEGLITNVPESNRRSGTHWASYTPTPTETEPNPKPRILPTLDKHLRNAIHPQHKLGQADATTSYYANWQKTAPQMLPDESNAFMTHKDITQIQKRTAIQYRCGQLYNNKLGMRWGHVTTDKCPLCGDPDGGHHIASGCKQLTNMYIARHNQAGRTILKAILNGERAAEVSYTDVGSADNIAKDNVPTGGTKDRRHNTKLPPHSTRPDIILTTRTSNTRDPVTNITLVEIKYCRDSDIQSQLDRATTQHQKLRQHLAQQHHCTVQILPILLGVSGAVYTNYTAASLQQLGVRGSPLKTTLRHLHTQAIQRLRDIVSTRRRLERKPQPTSGRCSRQNRGKQPPTRPRPARHRDKG